MKLKIGDSVLYKGEKVVVTDIQVKIRDKYSNSKQVKLINDDLMPFINDLHEFDTIEELNDYYVETKKTKNIHIEALNDLEQHQKHSFVNELSGILYDLKQTEKLLELYKDINNKRKELIALARQNMWSWILDVEIKEIQGKIKELENEEDDI